MSVNRISFSKKHYFFLGFFLIALLTLFLILWKQGRQVESKRNLTITSPLPGVSVIIDGTGGEADPAPKRTLPLSIALESGRHKIEATKEGYRSKIITVNLEEGKKQKLEISLKPARDFILERLPSGSEIGSFNWFDENKIIFSSYLSGNIIRELEESDIKTLFILPNEAVVYWSQNGKALIKEAEKFSLFTYPKTLQELNFQSSIASLSPTGNKIVYHYNNALYLSEGPKQTPKTYQLLENEKLGFINWHPKEQSVLLGTTTEGKNKLYQLDLGSGALSFVSEIDNFRISFSPSGQKLAYFKNKKFTINDLLGNNPEEAGLEKKSSEASFIWLDSEEVLLVEKLNSGTDEEIDNLWLLSLDEKEKIPLGVSAPIPGRIDLNFPLQASPQTRKKVLIKEKGGPLWEATFN